MLKAVGSKSKEWADIEKEALRLPIKSRMRIIVMFMESIRLEIEKNDIQTNDNNNSNDNHAEILVKENKQYIEAELCRFVKMLIPNIHQKIDEIIELDDMKKKNATKHKNTVVSQVQHGADIIDGDTGKCIELKTSIITRAAPKCNFNWNITSGTFDDYQERTDFLNNVKGKMANGGHAKFIIKSGVGVTIKEYEYSSDFLVEYFRRVPITVKTTKINFGCLQCKSCSSFHRLDTLSAMEKIFKFKKNKLDDLEWDTLFNKKVPSDCKKSQE